MTLGAATSTVAGAEIAMSSVPGAYRCGHPIVAARGEGPWIIDAEGRRYLDFGCGIGVTTLGHGHPRIVAAAKAQLDRLLHSGPAMINDQYVALAARLSAKIPDSRHWQALLLNSGSEATETAVKIARYATGRSAVIAFEGAWHGRTLLASALTGKAVPNKRQPGPLVADVFHAPYCDTYRPPAGVEPARAVEHALGRLQDLIHSTVPPEKVAAIIIEPLQGEGGFLVAPTEFMTGVEAFAREIGALLIMDEVQTGYGRTGTFFAYEQYPVHPDIVVVGKAIAGGLPLAGVLAPKETMDAVAVGDVGGTYGGNPVACAAGLAVLDLFDEEPFLARATQIGEIVGASLASLAARFAAIGDVRGRGAMQAIEFVEDRATRKPAAALTTRVVEGAREAGLIVLKAGAHANVIRLHVPVTISDADLDEAMRRLGLAIERASAA